VQAVLKAVPQQLQQYNCQVASKQQQQQQQQQPAKQQQGATEQQQQQLPTAAQLLASLVTNTAAAASALPAPAVASANQEMLCELWALLLQLLFPDVYSSNSSSSTTIDGKVVLSANSKSAELGSYPFHARSVLQLPADLSFDDASDDSWDESDSGWDEVRHDVSDGADDRANERSADHEAAGELMSAAVDPLYSVSAKRSLTAAKAALLHYLRVSQG
jgi:hypothetical protein